MYFKTCDSILVQILLEGKERDKERKQKLSNFKNLLLANFGKILREFNFADVGF